MDAQRSLSRTKSSSWQRNNGRVRKNIRDGKITTPDKHREIVDRTESERGEVLWVVRQNLG